MNDEEHCVLYAQAVEEQFGTLLRDYNQVRDDVAHGLGFYGQLQEAVKALHQEVGDYCLARCVLLVTTETIPLDIHSFCVQEPELKTRGRGGGLCKGGWVWVPGLPRSDQCLKCLRGCGRHPTMSVCDTLSWQNTLASLKHIVHFFASVLQLMLANMPAHSAVLLA